MRNDNAVYGGIEGPVDEERAREIMASSCLWNPTKGILVLDWYTPATELEADAGRVLNDGLDVTGRWLNNVTLTTVRGVTPRAAADFIARHDLTDPECETSWMNEVQGNGDNTQMTVDELAGELVREPGAWVRCWHQSLAPEEEGLTASIEEAVERAGASQGEMEEMAAARNKALVDMSDLALPDEVGLHDLVDAWRTSWAQSIHDAVSFGEIDGKTADAALELVDDMLARQFGNGVVNGTQPRDLVWTMPTPDGGRMSVLDRGDEAGAEPYSMLEVDFSPQGDYEGYQVVCAEATMDSVNSYAWRPGAEEYGYSCVDGVEEAETSRQAARGR